MENAEDLQEVKPGDRPSADSWNAMVRAHKALLRGANGVSGEGMHAYNDKDKSTHPYIEVTTTVEIPAYSVFSLSGTGVAFADPLRVSQDKFGSSTSGSPATLLTNGPLVIPANTIGHAWLIDYMVPSLVTVTGTAPTVGQSCGIGYGSFSVHKDRTGLVCCSVADADGRIWVARAREPVGIVGIVTTQISAYVPGTTTLGSGVVKVLYRNDSNVVADARSPTSQATPWSMTVYNFEQKVVPVDRIISAVDCIGIGLVVTGLPPTTPRTRCEFTLPSALTTAQSSKASCTVVASWGGDTAPGSTITAYNMATATGGLYHWEGDSGAHGYAEWDEVLAIWRIYDLNCPA